MKIAAITATCGRHRCIERTLAFFLNQDYKGDHFLLIYNNSDVEQSLPDLPLPENKKVLLINNHINLQTGEPYSNLGDIYTDTLSFIPDEYDVFTYMDDDDIFLPNHISAGADGLRRAHEAGKIAYKPAKSYYRDPRGISLMSNTLEPSIFVDAKHIRNYGFSPVTTEQHLRWVNPLVSDQSILVDDDGSPTLIYNWGDEFPTFKTSGNFHNPNNFHNYRNASVDHGDRILTPDPRAQLFYTLANENK
jgi:hypothetical protein